jgi:hypothetical protein
MISFKEKMMTRLAQKNADGLFENKWGVKYRISYEQYKELKRKHKLVLKHYMKALMWWRYERKLPANRLGNPPKNTKSDVMIITDQAAHAYWRRFYNAVKDHYRYMRAPVVVLMQPNTVIRPLPDNFDKVIERIEKYEAK